MLTMRMPRLALALALVVTAPSDAAAQSRPRFAGSWQVASDLAPNQPIPAGKPGTLTKGAAELVITQDQQRITMSRVGGLSAAYALDGSETINHIRVNGQRVPRTSRVTWEGDRMVMRARWEVDGKPWFETRTMYLDANGALVIEQTTLINGATNTVRSRYSRRSGMIS
jgi:hypothetical protein